MHHAHQENSNHTHLTACWTSLGKLARQTLAERRWLQSNAQALNPLVQDTVDAAVAREIGSRELANVAYGAALVFAMVGQPDAPLFTALAREAERHLRDFKPQNLANTAWAFATLGQPDAPLFTALAREAERRVRDFNPQELANTEWAFATQGRLDTTIVSVM